MCIKRGKTQWARIEYRYHLISHTAIGGQHVIPAFRKHFQTIPWV
jgi:hypothetical protein